MNFLKCISYTLFHGNGNKPFHDFGNAVTAFYKHYKFCHPSNILKFDLKGKRDRITLSRGPQDPRCLDAFRLGGVEGFAYAL